MSSDPSDTPVGSDMFLVTNTKEPPRKRPSMFEPPTDKNWNTLSEKEKIAKLRVLQEDCLRKEREIIRLIKLRNMVSTRQLPKGILRDAVALFKPIKVRETKQRPVDQVSERWIQILMKEYQTYRAAYPYDPGAEFFMPLPIGRPLGQLFTEDQKSIVRFALAERSRLIRSVHEHIRKIDVPFMILDIYNYAKSIDPSLPSYETIRRYIHRFAEQKPALFKQITEGEDAVARDLLQKKRNDVLRPNQRWQSDARDLPWYIKHNGKIHRVCLIIVYDDYTGYIVWWRLVLKEEHDIDAALKKVKATKRTKGAIRTITRPRSTTFTAEDVVLLLLTAMYRSGVRPEEIYTDNGSQYIKAEKLMSKLNDGDTPIIWRHSRPGEPWGRGKVEGKLGKLRSFLARVPGTYNKRNRMSIRAAQKRTDLYTYEEAIDELAKHFDTLNTRARKSAPSRFAVWQSGQSLKEPPIRRMAVLDDIVAVQQLVAVDDWSVNFDGDKWEPKVVEGQNRRIYRLLGDAIARGEQTWLSAVKLDVGWVVEVQLHGEWVEFVRKSTQQGNVQHNHDQASMRKDLRDEQRLMLDADRSVVLRISGSLPIQDAATGEYSLSTTDIITPPLDTPATNMGQEAVEHTSILPASSLPNEVIANQTTQAESPATGDEVIANQTTQAESSATEAADEKSASPPTSTRGPSQPKRPKSQKKSTASTMTTNKPQTLEADDELAGLPDFASLVDGVKTV